MRALYAFCFMTLQCVDIEKITLIDAARINVKTERITVVCFHDETVMCKRALEISHELLFVEYVRYGPSRYGVFCRYDHLFHVCNNLGVAHGSHFAQETVVFLAFQLNEVFGLFGL